MDVTVEKLLESPSLVLYLQRLEEVLARERGARERFYEEMTEGDKVEFINGEVIVHSPVKKRHSDCVGRLLTLLRSYVLQKGLGFVGFEKILVQFTRNDYEPDICFFERDKSQSFTGEQMFFPPPDFVAEVLSPSTAGVDRNIKFQDYAAHGVKEYWIVDPDKEVLEQYLLSGTAFELAQKSASGTVKSPVIKGFEVPVRAIFDDNENLRTLQSLLLSQ